MRILDRYITKEILLTFIFGIFAFSSVFIGSGTLYRIAQYVTKYGAPLSAVTKMFLYSLPGIVVLTFPMSMLLATLLSFGRLSGSSEITAMKSGGVSFYRISAPVYIIAVAVSIFAVFFNEYVVPPSNEAYANVIRYEIEKNTAPMSQDHVIIKQIQDGQIERLTYARRFDADTNAMYGISVQEFENEVLVRVQNAEKAQWSSDRWLMYNGQLHDLSADGEVRRTLKFAQQILPIKQSPREIIREQKDAKEMTMKELRHQIRAMKMQFIDTRKLEVELHQRVAIPFASLVFAMIGTPLGLQPNRQSSSIGFGISIIIIFIYYALMTVGSAFGQGGLLPPVAGAWAPNIIGLIAGAYLVRKAAK